MSWSDWLDFDGPSVDKVPESAGVYLMHASMKVMYIGGSENVRQSLLQLLADPCASKARRFHYMLTPSHMMMKEQLLRDYADKHSGKLPPCMEK